MCNTSPDQPCESGGAPTSRLLKVMRMRCKPQDELIIDEWFWAPDHTKKDVFLSKGRIQKQFYSTINNGIWPVTSENPVYRCDFFEDTIPCKGLGFWGQNSKPIKLQERMCWVSTIEVWGWILQVSWHVWWFFFQCWCGWRTVHHFLWVLSYSRFVGVNPAHVMRNTMLISFPFLPLKYLGEMVMSQDMSKPGHPGYQKK